MLQDRFHAAASKDPTKVAVVDARRRVSYDELQKAAVAYGRQLRQLGAQPGERVAILLPNGIDAAIALWGALEAACVIVPMHSGLKGNALERTLQDADPDWLVQVQGNPVRRPTAATGDSSDLAALLYTSGSTGEPKGVMLTHANMVAAIGMVNGYLKLDPEDIIYSALPLSSSYGLYQLLLGLTVSATVVLDRSFAFPAKCLESMARERATVLAAVPTMLGWMANTPLLEQHDLSSLRIMTSAAAALPPAHGQRLRERLPKARLFVMYGQTECKRISWLDPDDYARHPDSVGRGLTSQEHRIVNDAGEPVAPGELGELVVRGPHVMQGYWRRPDETAATVRPAAEGGLPWMHTGDAFTVDEEGFLYFSGRRDEVMKIGGHKVSPAEIENVLCQIPGVLEAAVVGVADDHWGQIAIASVVKVIGSDLTEDDIKRHCNQNLRGFMIPRRVRFLQNLPKTASGKILKRDLMRQVQES